MLLNLLHLMDLTTCSYIKKCNGSRCLLKRREHNIKVDLKEILGVRGLE
jgi:hypothetical protein